VQCLCSTGLSGMVHGVRRRQDILVRAAIGAAALGLLAACLGESTKDGDSGSGCSWRDQDAGPCSSSAECSSGDYCDPLGVDACPIDAGPLVRIGRVVGECFPICNQQSCTADEDCDPNLGCYSRVGTNNRCNGQDDCMCAESAGGLPPPTCPAGCPVSMLAHWRGYICDCATCNGSP